jgi:hypothetical protein
VLGEGYISLYGFSNPTRWLHSISLRLLLKGSEKKKIFIAKMFSSLQIFSCGVGSLVLPLVVDLLVTFEV